MGQLREVQGEGSHFIVLSPSSVLKPKRNYVNKDVNMLNCSSSSEVFCLVNVSNESQDFDDQKDTKVTSTPLNDNAGNI